MEADDFLWAAWIVLTYLLIRSIVRYLQRRRLNKFVDTVSAILAIQQHAEKTKHHGL